MKKLGCSAIISEAWISTTADISGIKLIKSGAAALLITGDGISVKASGIGPAKADSLYAWCQKCEEEARASCPVRLPAEKEAEIDISFKPRFESIEAQKAQVDQNAEQKRSKARQDLAVARARLAAVHQEKNGSPPRTEDRAGTPDFRCPCRCVRCAPSEPVKKLAADERAKGFVVAVHSVSLFQIVGRRKGSASTA